MHFSHGLLARYAKLRVAHAPGMLGTFSPPPQVSDPDMHHGMWVTHVPWCMQGSLTSGLLWSRWREKRSRHSRRMHNPKFYVSGKRPMDMHMMRRGKQSVKHNSTFKCARVSAWLCACVLIYAWDMVHEHHQHFVTHWMCDIAKIEKLILVSVSGVFH